MFSKGSIIYSQTYGACLFMVVRDYTVIMVGSEEHYKYLIQYVAFSSMLEDSYAKSAIQDHRLATILSSPKADIINYKLFDDSSLI